MPDRYGEALKEATKRDARSESTPGLTPAARMERVLDLLKTRDLVLVSELLQEFSVSEVTIRKDLTELVRQGLAQRVRGGARATTVGRAQDELAIDVRLGMRVMEKRAIAAAAAAMIDDGEAIVLDCSTAAYYLALELKEKKELVVLTNGLLAAQALASSPGIVVVLVGGVLRSASLSTVGDLDSEALRTTQVGKGFFGAAGLNCERGLMELNPEEVRLKRQLVSSCERLIGLVDHTKWGRLGLQSFAGADRVNTLITDSGAPADLIEEWRGLGTEVICVEANSSSRLDPAHDMRRRAHRLTPAREGVS
jgi:DeoR/GlpR family transcriptional regulator of sugar metabolism